MAIIDTVLMLLSAPTELRESYLFSEQHSYSLETNEGYVGDVDSNAMLLHLAAEQALAGSVWPSERDDEFADWLLGILSYISSVGEQWHHEALLRGNIPRWDCFESLDRLVQHLATRLLASRGVEPGIPQESFDEVLMTETPALGWRISKV